MSYEMVLERMKKVPEVALDEIYSYIEAVCDRYESTANSVEDGLAFIKKYAGSIDREINCKAELMEALDEKYGNID